MRRLLTLLALVPVVLTTRVVCSKVPPGYEGIVVHNFGTQRGVDDFPIRTGMVVRNPFTTDLVKYPTFGHNYVWTQNVHEGKDFKGTGVDESISFNSDKGVPISADVGAVIRCKNGAAPHLFLAYRQDLAGLIDGIVRNEVRDALNRRASKMNVLDIIGPGKAALLDSAKADLNDGKLAADGLTFDALTFVAQLRLDPSVMTSINAVIQATQNADQAEAKVRQSKAEAEQVVATAKGAAESTVLTAKANAEANDILMKSLSPTLLQYQAIQQWNGVLPTVTSGATPFIQVPTAK